MQACLEVVRCSAWDWMMLIWSTGHERAEALNDVCMAQARAASMEKWLPSSARSVLEALLMEPAGLAGRMQGLQSSSSEGAGPVCKAESKDEAMPKHLT